MNDNINKELASRLGQQIKELREARGMSVKELARAAHVSYTALVLLESGDMFGSIEAVIGIVHALGARLEINIIEKGSQG